jgi:hypothetical protein
MTISNRDISFYVDVMVVETLMKDEGLLKHAIDGGLVTSLIEKVKNYVGAHINPDDKAGSLINIIGPGVIWTTFRMFGFGWLGTLITLAMKVFNIDLGSAVTSIWDKLKGEIAGDKPTNSATVDSIVQASIQDNTKPITQDDANKFEGQLSQASYDQSIRDARLVKLTMIEFENGLIYKQAGILSSLTSRQSKVGNTLTKVIGLIFKVALASAGLMVAGDVVNKFIGRPNALDGSIQNGKPVGQTELAKSVTPVSPPTTQTKFKQKSSYKVETRPTTWTVPVANNEQSIGQMLIGFAKDVYDGLDGQEANIASTAGFQAIQDRITFFNRNAPSSPMVFIPPEFISKKQMVDYFIDDVAEKAK